LFHRDILTDCIIMMADDENKEAPPAPEEPAISLEPSKTAFVFIEFQNEFTSEGGKLFPAVEPSLKRFGTMENAAKVLAKAREAQCTVIHCPIEFEKGHNEISDRPYGILKGVKDGEAFTAGTWNAKICESMKPTENEIVVKGKSGLCGFASTNLDFLLRQRKIENVVLSGFLANCCVESTMRSAYELGYNVYTLKDCCGATDADGQEACFKYNFGMFSFPTTSDVIMKSIAA